MRIHWCRFNAASLAAVVVAVGLSATSARAATSRSAIVPDVPSNKAWDVDAAAATFTGGGHGPATISISLDKKAVSGRALSIQSDGDHLLVSDETATDKDAVPVALAVPKTGGADGTVSSLQLNVDDPPTVSLDGHESVAEAGHWRRVAHAAGRTVTLSITNATFAVIKFPTPAPAVPAPTPPARPTVAAPGAAPAAAGGHLKPARVQYLAKTFGDAVAKPCPACNGTGKVTHQVQVGSRKQGVFSVPIMENRTDKCEKCDNGTVRGNPTLVLREMSKLVQGMIDIDLTAANPREAATAQDDVKKVYALIVQNAIGDHRCWTILTKDARSTLSLAEPQVGTALITKVIVDGASTDAQGHRRFKAHLQGTENHFVIDNPPSADNVKHGPALMGGMIDRPSAATSAGDRSSVVVRGAFLIAADIDHRWWWWDKK